MASLTSNRDVTGKHRSDATNVQTRIGDEALTELGISLISVIKIDVEGAELQVLRGLSGTLRSARPPVIFEVLPKFYGHERIAQSVAVCAANQAAADAIHTLLETLCYEVF